MGLSYNPSSFATNKTILEAIEELKRYLMANPLACIYEMSGNVDPNILTYNLTGVIVPDGQELKVGDILLSDNGYYAFIDEIGETTVTVLQWTLVGSHITSMTLTSSVESVESTPTYLTGWIYRANAWTGDRYRILSYDLTLTYEDESMFPSTQVQSFTLPLQSINAIWYYLESDNSTTIYVDVNKDDGTNEVNSFSIPAGLPGQDGADGVSITGATIDANNHLILTLSDGNTIDAGALPTPNEYTHSVAISSTSGTFTDDEFAKLGYGDSTIVYTDAYSTSTVYKLKIETASILEFESIDASARQNLKLIDVNKTTKAFSSTGISMITSATFDSGAATSGKVLTANGTGGTSWETASGGTTLNKYTFDGFGQPSSGFWTRVQNVLCGAKGGVFGSYGVDIRLNDGSTALQTYIPVTEIRRTTGGLSSINAIFQGFNAVSGQVFGFIYATISSGQLTGTYYGKAYKSSDGTEIEITNVASARDRTYIEYYNDTQLH